MYSNLLLNSKCSLLGKIIHKTFKISKTIISLYIVCLYEYFTIDIGRRFMSANETTLHPSHNLFK